MRRNAAADLRAVLQGRLDIEALAAAAGRLPEPDAPLPPPAWTACGAVDLRTLDEVRTVVNEVVVRTEPQLTLRAEGPGKPIYLRRWWLDRETDAEGRGQRGLYVHEILRSDPTRRHDHPWPSASLTAVGRLIEHSRQGSQLIVPGTVSLRPARFRHRLALADEESSQWPCRAITVFATGERAGNWGFENDEGSVTEADESGLRMVREVGGDSR